MKNPHAMTPEEKRRLMAGEMPDIERRTMLRRILSWWTPERVADAIVEKSAAVGMSPIEYLANGGRLGLQ